MNPAKRADNILPRSVIRIDGFLPGLNEMIEAARRHPMESAKQKKAYTELCAHYMHGLLPFTPPVAIWIEWWDSGRRDIDNVAAGVKYILDALVGKKLLPDDDRQNIVSLTHRFHVDADEPRIEVSVYEVTGPAYRPGSDAE